MKKYFVYLDESGDFDSDPLLSPDKNGSIIGGVFWSNDHLSRAPRNLISKIVSKIGTDNHATELEKAKKGERTYSILKIAKSFPQIKFVVFQNDKKKKIINSTQTYLTVMTEGLIQLLKKLVVLENSPVSLEVIAGFKKDTTQIVTSSLTEGYIVQADYKRRLDEKIAVEKAKLSQSVFQQSSINIELADDKKNPTLILCDYVCNFWFTQNAKAFDKKLVDNGHEATVRTLIKKLYDMDYIFPLFNTEEDEHVLRMIQDGFYADALFEACANMLSDTNRNLIFQSLLKLPRKKIHRQLESLADYIGDLIVFRESKELSASVLDNAEKLFDYLRENSIYDDQYYLNIQLYSLAFLNSTGRISEMEQIFEKIEGTVADYSIRKLDVEFLMIFFTRKAVYYQEIRRYEDSCAVCDNMEMLLLMMEDAIRSNDLMKLNGDIRSEQLGKVLGTKLQAQIPLCYLGKIKYEEAL